MDRWNRCVNDCLQITVPNLILCQLKSVAEFSRSAVESGLDVIKKRDVLSEIDDKAQHAQHPIFLDHPSYNSDYSTMKRGSIRSHISSIIRSFINSIGRYFFKKKEEFTSASGSIGSHSVLLGKVLRPIPYYLFPSKWNSQELGDPMHRILLILVGKVLRSLPYYLFPSIPHF